MKASTYSCRLTGPTTNRLRSSLPQASGGKQTQDRPILRAGHRVGPAERSDRAGHHSDRTQPETGHHRWGCRDGGASEPLPGARLAGGPGLPLQPSFAPLGSTECPSRGDQGRPFCVAKRCTPGASRTRLGCAAAIGAEALTGGTGCQSARGRSGSRVTHYALHQGTFLPHRRRRHLQAAAPKSPMRCNPTAEIGQREFGCGTDCRLARV
jgi:hypothetical protein